MAVFDRPKTIVQKGGKGRDVEQYNATFAQAIVDLGVGVEMCAPRSGNQKGSVERLVGWVKSSFFKHRKFQDQTDLEAQLAAWHVEVNTKTPSRATGVIPEMRRQEELARLRPIKVFPEKLALRVPVFVGPTAEVMFEGVAYSMPPEATHVAGTLFLYEDRVVFRNSIVAEHSETIGHLRGFAPPVRWAQCRPPPLCTVSSSWSQAGWVATRPMPSSTFAPRTVCCAHTSALSAFVSPMPSDDCSPRREGRSAESGWPRSRRSRRRRRSFDGTARGWPRSTTAPRTARVPVGRVRAARGSRCC